MKWESGRQEATRALKKLTLVSFAFFDCYLLKIPGGAIIESHVDSVPKKRHWRANFTVKGVWCVVIEGVPKAQRKWSLHVFRPDIQRHSAVVKKDTLVVSVGVAV